MRNYHQRIFLFFVWGWMIAWTCLAQENVTQHVVVRGETVESIAKHYQLSADEIKAANPTVAVYYAGLKIAIPKRTVVTPSEEQGEVVSPPDHVLGALFKQASDLLKKEEYSKATEALTRIIKERPSAQLYLYRGYCYFERKKYKHARKDCAVALRCKDCDKQTERYCIELSKQAGLLQEERAERRGQIFAGILAVGAQTAMNVMKAKAMSENNNAVSSNYGMNNSGGSMLFQSNSAFSADMNRQLQNLALMSIYQVQQQEMNEYQSAAAGWKRTTGKDLSYGEWCSMKGAAIQQMNQAGNGGATFNSSSNSSSSSTSSTSSRVAVSSHQCPYCNGKGRIQKDMNPSMFGTQDYKVKCEECGQMYLKSTGHTHVTCGHCGGTGMMK